MDSLTKQIRNQYINAQLQFRERLKSDYTQQRDNSTSEDMKRTYQILINEQEFEISKLKNETST